MENIQKAEEIFLRFRDTLLNLISTGRERMDIDTLLNQLELDGTSDGAPQPTGHAASTSTGCGDIAQKRERLAAVIAGGQAERYLGRAISLDQVDKLTDADIQKLYARYEMIFGASICKTLGHAVLSMYSDLAAWYRPEINPTSLTADLDSNPFVELGMRAYSGNVYHRFGLLLTPLSIALTTFKHCKFGKDTATFRQAKQLTDVDGTSRGGTDREATEEPQQGSSGKEIG